LSERDDTPQTESLFESIEKILEAANSNVLGQRDSIEGLLAT